jgi:hypothetical protein
MYVEHTKHSQSADYKIFGVIYEVRKKFVRGEHVRLFATQYQRRKLEKNFGEKYAFL